MAEIKKVLQTNVQQGNKLGRIVEMTDGRKVFLVGRSVQPGDSPASSSPAPSSGGQSGGGGASRPTESFGSLGQFSIALKSALNEASANRTAANFQTIGQTGLVGSIPGTLGSVVDVIRGSAQTDASSIFESAVQGFVDMRDQAFNLFETLADDGALAVMSQGALSRLANQAGIGEEVAAGWASRIRKVVEMDEERQALELDKIRAEINETKANTSRLQADASSTRSGGGSGGVAGFGGVTGEEGGASLDAWALDYLNGNVNIGNMKGVLSDDQINQVVVRAQQLESDEGNKALAEDKGLLTMSLDRKIIDAEEARNQVLSRDDLTVEGKTALLDHIDEQDKLQSKNKGGKGVTNWLTEQFTRGFPSSDPVVNFRRNESGKLETF